jgi:hypothetical protein
MTKFERTLLSWTALNANLMDFNERDARKLLAMEQAGENRSTFIKRIRQRIIGAATEAAQESIDAKDKSD